MGESDRSRGILAPPAASQRDRAGGASPLSRCASQPKALVTWRTLSRLRDFLFETPTDPLGRMNLWATRICLLAMVAVWAMYLETVLL